MPLSVEVPAAARVRMMLTDDERAKMLAEPLAANTPRKLRALVDRRLIDAILADPEWQAEQREFEELIINGTGAPARISGFVKATID